MSNEPIYLVVLKVYSNPSVPTVYHYV